MPLPASAMFSNCFRPRTSSSSDSVSAESVMNHKNARKKLKSNPNGIPRPPPGMTRSELKQAAQEKLEMDVTNHYNFAFCGGSGTGEIKICY